MAWHGKIRPGLLLLLFSFVVISEATAKALGKYLIKFPIKLAFNYINPNYSTV